jgi:hypothetical protein
MKGKLTKQELCEFGRADRAVAFLESPAGRQFLNDLDALGWMLCLQGEALPDGERWPGPFYTQAKYPSWCDHSCALPELRLVEKHPDDNA